MLRIYELLMFVLSLANLGIAFLALYGFTTDWIAGTTTTGYGGLAAGVVERATNAGRYWGLMLGWLVKVTFGLAGFVVCGLLWRARYRKRKGDEVPRSPQQPNDDRHAV